MRTGRPSLRHTPRCSGETGFAETVKLTYDADILALNEIMAHYFRIVDPTTRDRQGNDIGTQYRSGVYYENKEDFEIVCDYIDFAAKTMSVDRH